MKVGHRERLKVGTNDFDQIKGLTDLRVQRNMISKCPGFDGLLRSGGRTRTYSDEAVSESVKLGLEADDGGKRREVTWQTPPAVPLVRSLTDWETISKLNNVYLREEGMSWLGERMTGQANLEFSSQPHQPLFLLQPTRTTDGPCLSFYHHPSTPMRERPLSSRPTRSRTARTCPFSSSSRNRTRRTSSIHRPRSEVRPLHHLIQLIKQSLARQQLMDSLSFFLSSPSFSRALLLWLPTLQL
jgi:hypothetical protein